MAIAQRQAQAEDGTYEFPDNFYKGLEAIGRIVVDAIQRLYTTERQVRIRTVDEQEDWVMLNHTVTIGEGENAKEVVLADLANQKYDVRVSAGPAYKTQRQEAVEMLIQFIQAVPTAGPMAMDVVARNMDWPGADELATRLKRALPPEVLEQSDLEERPMPPPSPEQELKTREAEAELKTQELKVVEKELEVEKQRLETQEAAAQVATKEEVMELVAAAMAELVVGLEDGAKAQVDAELGDNIVPTAPVPQPQPVVDTPADFQPPV